MVKNGTVLVCVTAQHSCRKLIDCGYRLAEDRNAALRILSVFPQKQCFCPDLDALDTLNAAALQYGAEMTVSFNDDVLQALRDAVLPDTVLLVTGFPGRKSTAFLDKIRHIPLIPLCMVDVDGTAYSIERGSAAARAELFPTQTV